MDKTLELKIKTLKKALTSLEKVALERKSDITRDALIKRFEYTFDFFWKVIKVFLYQEYGVDVFSPKETFRELHKNKIVSENDTELLLRMVNDRNEIAHTYNKKFADEIYKKIIRHYIPLTKKVFNLIKK